MKLYIDDTSINFLNLNLDSGSKSKVSTIADIHTRSYQQEGVIKTYLIYNQIIKIYIFTYNSQEKQKMRN